MNRVQLYKLRLTPLTQCQFITRLQGFVADFLRSRLTDNVRGTWRHAVDCIFIKTVMPKVGASLTSISFRSNTKYACRS
jgi:hypothetical protein